MFKLTGTITVPDGTVRPVSYEGMTAQLAQVVLVQVKLQGYTADLTATVTTGAGSVTYKIIVE